MKRSGWSAAIYLLLVFASGTAVGAFAHRLYMVHSVQSVREAARDPQQFRRLYMEEMKARLELSPEQETSVGSVLDDTRRQYRTLHERYRPEMKAIQDDQTSKINSLLDAKQQEEYAKMRRERDEKRKRDNAKYGL